jgi:hypothetical protein
LVARYAAHLVDLGRDLDQITRAQICVALEMIAAMIQAAGTSIPLQQVDLGFKAAIAEGRFSLSSVEAVEVLLEKNLLVTDGRHIRFWHQALQEHFCARHFANGWRGRGDRTSQLLSKAGRALASKSEEDTFAHLVAIVTEEEFRALFKAALRSNLSLAIRWADDLSCEQRWPQLVDSCANAVHLRVRRIAKAQRIIALQDWLCTPKLAYLQVTFGVILLFVWPLVPILAIGLHLVGLVLRSARLSPVVESKPLLIVALRGLGSKTLRERLAADLASTMRTPELDVGSTQTLGIGDKSEATLLQEELEWSMSDDDHLFTRLSYLGYLDGESVLPFLINVAQRRNCYARRALDVMRRRVVRFPAERAQIEGVARTIYDDKKINFLVRGQARRLLKTVGVNVGVIRDVFGRRLKRWVLVIGAGICTVFVLQLLGSLFLLIGDSDLRGLVLQVFGLSLLALPIWVFNDCSGLGGRRIKGCLYWDGLGPEHYAFLVFLFWLFFLPAYLLARGRIRDNHREWMASESSGAGYSRGSVGLGIR